MARTSHLLARLGIAAAALTAPLAFPTLAKADPARHELWDRVALCESEGNWSANTGNGYYGGLQFSRSTWNSFGGRTYANTPNYATRLQQIAIAEKVLQAQGWNAWPTCSPRAGAR
jgi:resuscitation-promoting factor RpfA